MNVVEEDKVVELAGNINALCRGQQNQDILDALSVFIGCVASESPDPFAVLSIILNGAMKVIDGGAMQ